MDDGGTIFQPSSAGSVPPGTCLNGIYEVERRIAEGGMGEVYRGFNIQTRDIVAIKMIRPELSNDPDAFDLFRREASILYTLQHEAIVRYFVFSVDPQLRRAYLAMEFVDGPSLANKLVSGPLSLIDVNVLRSRISSGLQAAHVRGVVHRDISSDNIIFPNGDVRSAKIIDFGIARSLMAREGTIIGSGFAGKHNYVSPEQLGLAGGEVTDKSDIYSFELVLAEALRGRPIDMSGSQSEIIEKRRVVPDLSDIEPSIRPLIRWMLQPLPVDRPASMAAVGEWRVGPGADAGTGGIRATRSQPRHASSGGHVAAIIGTIIAILSVGGVAFVFRGDLAQWVSLAPAPPPRLQAIAPPLKPAEPRVSAPAPETSPTVAPGPAPEASPAAREPASSNPPPGSQSVNQPPPAGEEQNPTGHQPPKSQELVDAMPPQAPSPNAFLDSFDGGDCFLVRPVAGSAHSYLGVGLDRGPFQRFEEAYKLKVGAEPQLSVRRITPSECPVVDLIRPRGDEATPAPAIELSALRLSPGEPLAGAVTNLRGRRLALVLVDNDGKTYLLDAKPEPNGNSAKFSINLTPDTGSIGPTQLVLAIVSPKPLPLPETLHWGDELKKIAPTLLGQVRSGSASIGVEFFTFAR